MGKKCLKLKKFAVNVLVDIGYFLYLTFLYMRTENSLPDVNFLDLFILQQLSDNTSTVKKLLPVFLFPVQKMCVCVWGGGRNGEGLFFVLWVIEGMGCRV